MNQMIFCDGYFYCLIFHQMNQMERRRRIPMILIFSIQDAREMRFWVQPMPEDNGRRMYCLITCGSRLLMVSAKIEPNGLVIIWEFHKSPSDSSWRWEEIARMHEFLRDLLNWYESAVEGVGDCVCFISGRGTSVVVLVYNLNKKSWKWLPDTPLYFDTTHTKCMAFEPRPAINIE